MSEVTEILKDFHESLEELEEAKRELYSLKRVARDIRNYRKMIPLKRYD